MKFSDEISVTTRWLVSFGKDFAACIITIIQFCISLFSHLKKLLLYLQDVGPSGSESVKQNGSERREDIPNILNR